MLCPDWLFRYSGTAPRLLAQRFAESRDAQLALPVSGDTLFGVASVTKVLTAVMVMLARKDNLVRLSDPMSKFYPALDCARDGKIRIQHLLSHSAGFPGLPFRHMASRSSSEKIPDPILTPDQLVEAINFLRFDYLGPPGSCISYSNESFCLLGGILETLYGCTFAQAAERLVFRPLHMNRSVIGASATAAVDDLAMPLRHAGSGFQSCGFWDAPLFDPAGGLVVSVRDMCRLISVLDGTSGLLGRDEAHDMISNSLPVASRPASTSRYGLGLEVTRLIAGHSLAWHTGHRPGISSFVGYVPEKALSVAVATNMADAPSAVIGHRIIAEALSGELDPGLCRSPPQATRHATGKARAVFAETSARWRRPTIRSVSLTDKPLLAQGMSRHRLHFAGSSHGTVGGQTFCFLGDNGPAAAGETATALALDLRILPRRRCDPKGRSGGASDETPLSIPTQQVERQHDTARKPENCDPWFRRSSPTEARPSVAGRLLSIPFIWMPPRSRRDERHPVAPAGHGAGLLRRDGPRGKLDASPDPAGRGASWRTCRSRLLPGDAASHA